MTTTLIIAGLIIVVIAWLLLVNRIPDHSRYDQPEPELIATPQDISDGHQKVLDKLAAYHSQPRTNDISVGRQRFAGLFPSPEADDIQIKPVDLEGLTAEWLMPDDPTPGLRLLYLHGGAFMVGNPETHRFVTTTLARLTGATVLAVNYRKAPEHKIIACHEDAQKAYRHILNHGPAEPGEPEHLFVAGDSAGGALTLSTIAWARDSGLRAADGAIGFAPATDASLTGPTWQRNLKTDHFLGPGFGRVLKIPSWLRIALGKAQYGRRTNDPLISPLFNDLSNLPPILIQVSTAEMLYGDGVRYANKATAAGSSVTVQAWPELVHVFQLFEELPEAHDALEKVATFIKSKTESRKAA